MPAPPTRSLCAPRRRRAPGSALVWPLVAVALLLVLLPARAGAQGAHTGGGSHTGGGATTTAPRDAFSEAYTEASRAWHEGRYEDALSRFRALYRSSERHELLYDIGVTADRLGRLEESIEAFEQYLVHVPAAQNRTEVEHRIASLREDLRERDHIATTAPPRTTAPRSDRPVMRLQGASTIAPGTPPVASGPPPGAIAGVGSGVAGAEPGDEQITTGGGPEWIWTWPLLVLTIGSAIATPIAWDQGFQALDRLHTRCAAQGGCTEEEIGASDAKSWELATNVLLVSTLALGGITVIVFLAEGLSGGPTVVRRADRARVGLRLGLGGLGVEGTF